jgi:hypothetical protein
MSNKEVVKKSLTPPVFLRLKRSSMMDKETARAMVAEHVRALGFQIEESDIQIRTQMPDLNGSNALLFKPGSNGLPVLCLG